MINETLTKVVDGHEVTRDEARATMAAIMAGECTPAQIGAFLVALRMRGETVEQISGFAEAMRDNCVRIRTRHEDVVDTCGTGGDRKGTFNVSTAAALVAAGARRQVLGVFSERLVETIARVLRDLGAERAMVVHSDDGLDELSICAETAVAAPVPTRIRKNPTANAPNTKRFCRCGYRCSAMVKNVPPSSVAGSQ